MLVAVTELIYKAYTYIIFHLELELELLLESKLEFKLPIGLQMQSY